MKIKFGKDEIDLNLANIVAIVYSNKNEGINHPIVRQFSRAGYQDMVSGILSSKIIDGMLSGSSQAECLAVLKKFNDVFPDAPSLNAETPEADKEVREYIKDLYQEFPCYVGDGFMDGNNLYWGEKTENQVIEFDVY